MTVRFGTLWRGAAQGRSLRRMLIIDALSRWQGALRGTVLDLGCGREPEYWSILGLRHPGVRLTGIDINPAFRPAVVADLRQPIPVRDHSVDAVVTIGFLGMTATPLALMADVHRVLKPGGTTIFTAPLTTPYDADVHYFRFSERALRWLCREAGFQDPQILPVGERFSAAAGLLSSFLRPRWLVAPFVYWIATRLDGAARRIAPASSTPITYLVKARA